MSQPIVLIIFYCRNGETEKLALQAAVGAVQARALIRLRRLGDTDDSPPGDDLHRMRKEYVPPTEADILNADTIVLAAPPELTDESAELSDLFGLLRELGRTGKLKNKVLAGIGQITNAISDLQAMIARDSSGDALALGRRVAEAARSAKRQKETP